MTEVSCDLSGHYLLAIMHPVYRHTLSLNFSGKRNKPAMSEALYKLGGLLSMRTMLPGLD